MTRAFATWMILLFAAAPALGQTVEQKKETVNFLRCLQVKDGGFQVAPGQGTSSLRATTAALRGLKYFGGEPADSRAAGEFVKRCFDPGAGGFADRPGAKVEVFASAVGIMAANELKLDPEPFKKKIIAFLTQKARSFEEFRIAAAAFETLRIRPLEFTIEQLESPRHESDEMRMAFFRALAIKRVEPADESGPNSGEARIESQVLVTVMRLGILRLNGSKIAPHNLKTLVDDQASDGGFGKKGAKHSDLESSYYVMRAFHMLKAKPDVGKMRSFIATCRSKDGGYGVTPGKPSTAPATYYAGIILHWLDEK